MHVHAIVKLNNEFYDIKSTLLIKFLLWSIKSNANYYLLQFTSILQCLSIFLTWQPKPLLESDAMWLNEIYLQNSKGHSESNSHCS
jgi:hypothetical protein